MGWCYMVTPLSWHSLLSLDAVEPLNSPGGPTNAAQSPAGRAASLRPSGHVGTAQTFCNPASSCSVPIACLLFRYSIGWVFYSVYYVRLVCRAIMILSNGSKSSLSPEIQLSLGLNSQTSLQFLLSLNLHSRVWLAKGQIS